MHLLGHQAEHVEDGFKIEELLRAQELSWKALAEIARAIQPGMTELSAIDVTNQVLKQAGSECSWHRPVIRLGRNTALPFNAPADPEYRLGKDEPFFVDIGPVWKASNGTLYEGDVGQTYNPGQDPRVETLISCTRQLFEAARTKWKSEGLTGEEMYDWLRDQATTAGYELVPEDDGHRTGIFPHKRTYSGALRVPFTPTPGIWILEVHLRTPDRGCGAFFEDILA